MEVTARFTVARTCLAWSQRPARLPAAAAVSPITGLSQISTRLRDYLAPISYLCTQPASLREAPLPAGDISGMTCTLHPEDPLRLNSRDSSQFYGPGSVIDLRLTSYLASPDLFRGFQTGLICGFTPVNVRRLALSNTAICCRAAKEHCVYFFYICACLFIYVRDH